MTKKYPNRGMVLLSTALIFFVAVALLGACTKSLPSPAPTAPLTSTTTPTTISPAPTPVTSPGNVPGPTTTGPTAVQPEEVSFPNGNLVLRGYLWKPEGAGPFPAILWNHGSEKLPGTLPELGPVFTSKGYVLFIPHRRGQGRSSTQAPHIMDLLEEELRDNGRAAWSRLLVALHAGPHLDDQLAALSYLKSIRYVNPNRIAVAGISFGGIQTMLAAEQDRGLRSAISFAGAAQTWSYSSDLRERLLRAARQAAIPVYFIQAENDYDLNPSKVLGDEMQRAGKPYKIKIYPAFGATAQDGHTFGVRGIDIWGTEVFSFLGTTVTSTP